MHAEALYFMRAWPLLKYKKEDGGAESNDKVKRVWNTNLNRIKPKRSCKCSISFSKSLSTADEHLYRQPYCCCMTLLSWRKLFCCVSWAHSPDPPHLGTPSLFCCRAAVELSYCGYGSPAATSHMALKGGDLYSSVCVPGRKIRA